MNDKEFKTEERLFQIEQKLASQINKEDLKAQLKQKASKQEMIVLRENLDKFKVNSIMSEEN